MMTTPNDLLHIGMVILIRRRKKGDPGTSFTDVDGRIWATFVNVGFTQECARCGVEISKGLWRAGSDEYIGRDHVQVAGE